MKKLLDPAYWGRALSNPTVLVGLAVDLLPVYGVLAWGWSAVPLVLLYWIENVIAGVMTIPRIVMSGAAHGGLGLAVGAGLSVFFVFHYGLFCLVHGTFLIAFASFTSELPNGGTDAFMNLPGMIEITLESGRHVDWMIYAIFAFQLVVFATEFVFKGAWKNANPMAEMMTPYSRIVVLHFGIFAGAGALFLLGQPMIGVLALILFRALWGIVSNSKRFGTEAGVDRAVARIGSREQFEKLLRGQKPDAP